VGQAWPWRNTLRGRIGYHSTEDLANPLKCDHDRRIQECDLGDRPIPSGGAR
jgi:hypothetical protein